MVCLLRNPFPEYIAFKNPCLTVVVDLGIHNGEHFPSFKELFFPCEVSRNFKKDSATIRNSSNKTALYAVRGSAYSFCYKRSHTVFW
jgi:hypothetical protein